MMNALFESLNWLFRQFGRASMLARLSMLFNIVLGYSVMKIHENEDSLRREVIKCHELRHSDMQMMMRESHAVKKQAVDNLNKIQEVKEAVENIIP
jgi:hypothetical protein